MKRDIGMTRGRIRIVILCLAVQCCATIRLDCDDYMPKSQGFQAEAIVLKSGVDLWFAPCGETIMPELLRHTFKRFTIFLMDQILLDLLVT